MLPQIFPSYSHSADQGWNSENSGSTLRCAVLQLAVLYAVFWAAIWQENGAPSFPASLAPPTPGGTRYSGQTVHAPIVASFRVPDGHPPIEDPAPPVGMVRRPPWSIAIAICPMAINSPRPLGGFNSPERVDRVSFGVAMLTISTLILTDLLAMANGSSAHLD